MKKVLFGYDVKETDNLFNSMQNHIDVLTGKVTNLNAELSSKSTPSIDTEEADKKISQLHSKIAELEKENSMLKRELNMHARIESKPEIHEEKQKVEYVGKIYLAAYEDAEKIKKNAIVDAQEYLEKFVDLKKDSKEKFISTLAEIRVQQTSMEGILNNSVQKIVEMLRDFDLESNNMLKKINAIEVELDNKNKS